MKKILLTLLAALVLIPTTQAFEANDIASSIVYLETGRLGVLINNEGLILSTYSYDDIGLCHYESADEHPDCEFTIEQIAENDPIDLYLAKIVFEDGETIEDYGLIPLDFSDTETSKYDTVNVISRGETWIEGVKRAPTFSFEEREITGHANLEEDTPWFYTITGTLEYANHEGPVLNEDGEFIGFSQYRAENNYWSSNEVGWLNYGDITSIETIKWWLSNLAEEGTINEEFLLEERINEDLNSLEFFDDIDFSSEHANSLAYLKTNGLISGYSDGEFKQDNPINRAELLKIFVEGIYGTPDEDYSDCFDDVTDEWYAKYVCYAKEQGWVEGYSDGTFQPGTNINKVEAMAMLLKVFTDHIEMLDSPVEGAPAFYLDVSNSAWYADYLYTGSSYGIIEKDIGSYYGTADEMTRGEISENLYRLLKYHIQTALNT